MKTVTVMSNDSTHPEMSLTVSGNVERFVTITPPVLRLNGKIGEDLKSEVKIIPEGKYPFSIKKVSAQDGQNIKFNLSDAVSEKSGSKEYRITVENLKKDAGAYYDVLTVETDSKIQPEIKITLIARIIDAKAPVKAPLAGGSNIVPSAVTAEKGSAAGYTGFNKDDNGKKFMETIHKLQQ